MCHCLSVCLSVRHKPVPVFKPKRIETTGRSELVFGMDTSFHIIILHCVVKKFGYFSPKLAPNSGVISPRQIDRVVDNSLGLLDHIYDGRHAVAGRSMLYTHCAHSFVRVRRP